MSGSTHKVPSLVLHLNAGASHRVVKFVTDLKNADIKITRSAFGDYSYITITNQTQEDINTFLNKFKNIYPVEFDYNFTPPPPTPPKPKPKPKSEKPSPFPKPKTEGTTQFPDGFPIP